ncbi:nuclear receptor subfamily 2 group C member 2 isoform X2 [Megalobrama amblycephala]|uniref:nuclear receptor subfamily 2 group C member 2 isoform X2 n=1 Tax=Megalobrama amblycephala TaxID=75352 RepID=UPI002013E249|nr:nuclear receptor subfamily 2 group C member 2 isoform X2 [Megalobrama amblycephala]
MTTNMEVLAQQILTTEQVSEVQSSPSDSSVMSTSPQRIQIISTDPSVTTPQRIQIVTEQQTGQKIQIVTALDSTVPKQQFILAAPDGSSAGKVLLASPESTSAKQLIFATADSLVPGRIQFVTDAVSVERLLGKGADMSRAQPIEYCVVCGDKASAVQSERKPIDLPREKPANCAASTEKIYIRKDLRSPLIATPTFITEKDASRSRLLDSGMLVNIQQPLIQADGTLLLATDKAESGQGDLGTLANVVTSLANLNDSLSNGETTDDQMEESPSEITRAFDTLAKALNPSEAAEGRSLSEVDGVGGATIQVISRDQITPLIEVEGPLLTDTHVSFKLTMPSPMPEYLNVHYICESASRLLFLSMHWARSIPAFLALGQECNTALVRACWNELFILGLAQCAQIMSLSTILAAIVNHLQSSIQDVDKLSSERIKLVMEHIWKLQEFCNSMAKLQTDGYEYAYLKAIVLFSPDHPGLSSCSQIEKFQEKAQMELQDYVQKTYPEDTYRLARILLRLPALRSMSSNITEELFFTGLIGNVPIDSIIPYILKMETADYNSQMTGPAV